MLNICDGNMVEYDYLKKSTLSDFLVKFELYVKKHKDNGK